MLKNQTEKAVGKNPFALMEEDVLKFWEDNKIFEKSLAKDAPKGDYVFYDGPPFATGMPHYGHLVASIMKDAVPRYFTMNGYRVERRWGWDCHGLPVENLAEKELGFKDKTDIEKMGVKKFNEYCESIVMRYANDWKGVIKRIGRWVDMENDYKTMDPEFMESVWWVFKALWDKGLIYQGHKAMHICPRCGTTLSNFEVGQNYKDVKDLSAIAKFEVRSKKLEAEGKTYILAWTTTPWTLIGNVALAVGEDIEYELVSIEGEEGVFILAKERVAEVLKLKSHKIIRSIVGKDLIGLEYEPLFDFYSSDKKLKNKENGWKVYAGDFVTTEDGTGIVHIAPAFGEDDLDMGKKFNLPFVQHVDSNGRFSDAVKNWPGREVKPLNDVTGTDIEIIKYLAHKGLLFHKEKYEHSYPHCWRCDTPLLNYATESWFVEVTKVREQLVKNNQSVNWVPEHVRDGRFGKWLEQARDWAISRNRYWGSCLPVWRCAECQEIKVIGSIKELEKYSGQEVTDLHKQFVDEIGWDCEKCAGRMQRTPEVLDCWFESGSMPYAQRHYLGQALNGFDPEKRMNFPAQFIAEGIDQTRGWFYTLMVLGTALFDFAPYQNVIANGIVLAEDGQKMSKSKKNYPDPTLVFDKYGVDALRLYLLGSPVLAAENLNFSENGVKETLRKSVMLIWNVFKFYDMFSQEAKAESSFAQGESPNVLDKWILIRLNELIAEMGANIEKYNFPKAARPIAKFVDDLSTWYLRRSRERFKGDDQKDKACALQTTKYVLLDFSKAIAPLMPFISEQVWQKVSGFDFKDQGRSVHLEQYPRTEAKPTADEGRILEEMDATRKIVELALFKRDVAGIKVRQPLGRLFVRAPKTVAIKNAYINLIKDEVNVKEIEFTGNGEDIAVELDTELTPELRQEGVKRELVRQINSLRKNQELTIGDQISLYFETNSPMIENVISAFENELKCDVLALSIKKGIPSVVERNEINVEGELVILAIEKINK